MSHSTKTIEAAKRFTEAFDKRAESQVVLSALRQNMEADLTPKGRTKKCHKKIFDEAAERHMPLAENVETSFFELKTSMYEDDSSDWSTVMSRICETKDSILSGWDCGLKDITNIFIFAQDNYLKECSDGWHEDSKTSYAEAIRRMRDGFTCYIDTMSAVDKIIGNSGNFDTDGIHAYIKFTFSRDGRLMSASHTVAEGDYEVREYSRGVKNLCHEFTVTHDAERMNFCAYGTKSAGFTAVEAASRIFLATIHQKVCKFIKEGEDMYPKGIYDLNFGAFVEKARSIASSKNQ